MRGRAHVCMIAHLGINTLLSLLVIFRTSTGVSKSRHKEYIFLSMREIASETAAKTACVCIYTWWVVTLDKVS